MATCLPEEGPNRTYLQQDSEVFEISDFTTASEWERFMARLEEVLYEWKINALKKCPIPQRDEFTHGKWSERQEEIRFADHHFKVSQHRLEQESDTQRDKQDEYQDSLELDESDQLSEALEDIMSLDNDFPSRSHCLTRWFGLRHFIVISPAAKSDDIISESRINILLSSICIVLNNMNCHVPVFVQVCDKWRKMYFGICESTGMRTHFDMVHLKRAPHQYRHLSGFLEVFKSKLACPVSTSLPVNVSIRFTYIIDDWSNFGWPLLPPDLDIEASTESDEFCGPIGFDDLPFGCTEDPIASLQLYTTWPCLTEDVIIEGEFYSDLHPLQAPRWSMRVMTLASPQCLLHLYVGEFVALCQCQESTDQVLGRSAFANEQDENLTADVSQALQKLTDPTPSFVPSLSSVVDRTRLQLRHSHKDQSLPLDSDRLNELLPFLFTDVKPGNTGQEGDSGNGGNSDGGVERGGTQETGDGSGAQESQKTPKLSFKQFKSAPEGSLPYKLATSMCVVNVFHGGIKAVAHLWQEFVLELRYRWENDYFIPDLEEGIPNLGCCILYQKLQMLNCCIKQKKARKERELNRSMEEDRRAAEKAKRALEAREGSEESNSEEDDFVDCHETVDWEPASQTAASGDNGEGAAAPDAPEGDQPAEGRVRQCGDLQLLNRHEGLYIPLTQDPSPMTEDQLEEHAEVLTQLGTSEEGAELRTRMQSASLLSDMEAFKAANPGCVLEDFVRWYSPRDWIEEDSCTDDKGRKIIKGSLSPRMMLEGNIWQEVWSQSRAVPVRRQKRLFDDTREAEKVLHYLELLKPAQFVLHLLPPLLHCAVAKLHSVANSKVGKDVPNLKSNLEQLTERATRVTRAPLQDFKKYEEVVSQLYQIEATVARYGALKSKFNGEGLELEAGQELEEGALSDFVGRLLTQPEVLVIGAGQGPLGTIVQRMFSFANQSSVKAEDASKKPAAEPGEGDEGEAPLDPLPPPEAREYLLRTVAPRPAAYSKPSPQRIYCLISKDEFRLAGAFTEDTTFQ